jgi:hypothetical protein
MKQALPTTIMTWARLPAGVRRRLAVQLGQLARRQLASAPVLEDHGHDRDPSRAEEHDERRRQGPKPPL